MNKISRARKGERESMGDVKWEEKRGRYGQMWMPKWEIYAHRTNTQCVYKYTSICNVYWRDTERHTHTFWWSGEMKYTTRKKINAKDETKPKATTTILQIEMLTAAAAPQATTMPCYAMRCDENNSNFSTAKVPLLSQILTILMCMRDTLTLSPIHSLARQ